MENDVTYVPASVAGGLESVRLAGVDGRPTMAERASEGGLESVRRAGVNGSTTMAERGAAGGIGTKFSKLSQRVRYSLWPVVTMVFMQYKQSLRGCHTT